MIKPAKLVKGDTIATISPSWGCAGAPRVRWKYQQGCERLHELGLNVVAAPNSLKGTAYLRENPQARAEDLLWAFENPNVKAILANIGGNDAVRLLPYLSQDVIRANPKILCGYSDVLALHLFCYRAGLQTFYGDNLLTTVAEGGGWHPYSRRWFEKTLMEAAPIGTIEPSADWSYDKDNHTNRGYRKTYVPNPGILRVQGQGAVRGRLFGGHGDLLTLTMPDGTSLVQKQDFEGAILFFEDIPEFCDERYLADFFDRLGQAGYLQTLHGVILGKMRTPKGFETYAEKIREVVTGQYHCPNLLILADLNFGHSSPMFLLPYGAEAEIDAERLTFSILDSGVESIARFFNG